MLRQLAGIVIVVSFALLAGLLFVGWKTQRQSDVWARRTIQPKLQQYREDEFAVGFGRLGLQRSISIEPDIIEFRKLQRHKLPFFLHRSTSTAVPVRASKQLLVQRLLDGFELDIFRRSRWAHTSIGAPLWFFELILACPPLAWLKNVAYPAWRRRRFERAGRCGSCGYDLRGSSLRCPECGRALGVRPDRQRARLQAIFGGCVWALVLAAPIGTAFWWEGQQKLNEPTQARMSQMLTWDVGKLDPLQEMYIEEGLGNWHRALPILSAIQGSVQALVDQLGPVRVTMAGSLELVPCAHVDRASGQTIRNNRWRCLVPEHPTAAMWLKPNVARISRDVPPYHIELTLVTEVIVREVNIEERCNGEMEDGRAVASEQDCRDDGLVVGIDYFHTVRGVVTVPGDKSSKPIPIYAWEQVQTALDLDPSKAKTGLPER